MAYRILALSIIACHESGMLPFVTDKKIILSYFCKIANLSETGERSARKSASLPLAR
jgi:hypothetical protein